MNIKSIIIATISAFTVIGGSYAYAASAPRLKADIQDDIKILSAKIENAIADLGEERTRDDIKSATLLVMNEQNASLDIKSAALNMVIQNAILIEDGQVVGALKAIEFEPIDLRDVTEIRTDADETQILDIAATQSKPAFPPPPAASAPGGSDY